MTKKEKKITLTMNETQLQEILTWMEFYFRFMLGQVNIDELREISWKNFEEFEEWVIYTKKFLFNQRRWESLSYNSLPLTYEITRKILQERNKTYNIDNVYSSEPLKCTKEPFIEVKFED